MNREGKAKLGELNHLSNLGKEIKRDSESSGERNWRSLNLCLTGVVGPRGLAFGG